MSNIPANIPLPRWRDPTWYYALSLTERVASLQESKDKASISPQQMAKATQRLQAWKAQKPFDQGTLFADRLAMDTITEDDLLFLLAEPIATVQSRYLHSSSTPGWLTAFIEAFEHYDAGEMILPFQEMIARHPLTLYLQPLRPLLRRALDQLQVSMQALQQQYASLPFDPQQVVQALFMHVPEYLLTQLSKTFVLEMHVARIQQRLQGETPEARFKDFVRQLSQEKKILSLLNEYPVLARQLVIAIDHWASYTQEFLCHLCADWQDICATFLSGRDPGLLVEIQKQRWRFAPSWPQCAYANV